MDKNVRAAFTIAVFLTMFGGVSLANAADASSAQTQGANIAQSFECRKLEQEGSGLKALKASLVDNCDLSQPFSFTQVNLGIGASSFVLCCHKKQTK